MLNFLFEGFDVVIQR